MVRKLKHIGIMFSLLLLLTLAHVSSAEPIPPLKTPTFEPEIKDFPPLELLSYKEIRAREICGMAKSYGFNQSDCEMMIAHQQTECGQMDAYCGWTEGSYRSDAGLAIGLFQFHLCYRYADWMRQNRFGCPHGRPWTVGKIRDKFFQDFPEMKTWRGQVTKYLTEQSECVQTKSLRYCIDRWNSHPQYMHRVQSKLTVAKTLLY